VSQVEQTPGMRGRDMNPLTLKQIDVQSDAKDSSTHAVRSRKLTKIYSGGAIIGLFGSAAVPLFGAILTGASWFIAEDGVRKFLSVTGSILLFMTIPLIVISACCLDWMEKDESGIVSKPACHGDEADDDQ
jgi:hypothetical protein